MSASPRSLTTLALGLVLTLALSGCGTKGPLEPPSAAVQQQQPDAGKDKGIGDIPTMGQKKKAVAPVEAPNKPFFLDFLL